MAREAQRPTVPRRRAKIERESPGADGKRLVPHPGPAFSFRSPQPTRLTLAFCPCRGAREPWNKISAWPPAAGGKSGRAGTSHSSTVARKEAKSAFGARESQVAKQPYRLASPRSALHHGPQAESGLALATRWFCCEPEPPASLRGSRATGWPETANPQHESRSVFFSQMTDRVRNMFFSENKGHLLPRYCLRISNAEARRVLRTHLYLQGCWLFHQPQTLLQHQSHLQRGLSSPEDKPVPRGNTPWGPTSRSDPRPQTEPWAGRRKRPDMPQTS